MDINEVMKMVFEQLKDCEQNRPFPNNLGAQMLLKCEEHLEAVKEVNNYLEPGQPGSLERIAEELIDDMVVSLRILKRM